ncbi:MAG: UDP-glucose 4-epimerase GalE [Paracoccaceae bacterium]
MKTILVTGGGGYIGSHACKALSRSGYRPVTFDNFSTGWREAVRFGPLEEGDLTDRRRIAEVFARYRPDAVMHFAALSEVGQSVTEPMRYWRNNVLGGMNLIEAMLESGIHSIVFSSTCATYGDQDGVLLTEDTEQKPANAYGSSKMAIEEMLRDAGRVSPLRHVIFRYFNVAGADPEAEIGENHTPETHLVPRAIQAAQGRGPALTIFGTDYPTPDGTCIRDYVHVADLVDAHLRAMDWLQDGKPSAVFNLGTGNGFSVREVLRSVERIAGREVPFETGERRPGDCTSLVSAATRAMDVLGWRPRRSTLDDMVRDAWRWHETDGFGT